jgi:hypothetical protein
MGGGVGSVVLNGDWFRALTYFVAVCGQHIWCLGYALSR